MLQTDKQQLRRYYREARRALSADEKQVIDRGITANLLKSNLYRDAACIFCYVSTKDEIDTTAILEQSLADGKTLCVPLCGRAGEMSARRIRSLNELQSGAYGILEPRSDAPEIAPDSISLVIVPALSCDRDGYRLGYGGGYYDRFLARAHAVTAALCAESRLTDKLPREPFDLPCNYIITERQVLHTNEK